jgi:hypothetical protein
VVEHKDRATRFGCALPGSALEASWTHH